MSLFLFTFFSFAKEYNTPGVEDILRWIYFLIDLPLALSLGRLRWRVPGSCLPGVEVKLRAKRSGRWRINHEAWLFHVMLMTPPASCVSFAQDAKVQAGTPRGVILLFTGLWITHLLYAIAGNKTLSPSSSLSTFIYLYVQRSSYALVLGVCVTNKGQFATFVDLIIERKIFAKNIFPFDISGLEGLWSVQRQSWVDQSSSSIIPLLSIWHCLPTPRMFRHRATITNSWLTWTILPDDVCWLTSGERR